MDIAKVNSLEEARKHFLQNDAVGQVPPVICVKDGEERQVENLAEAEAFYGEVPGNAEASEAKPETETGTESHEDTEKSETEEQ